MKIISHANIVPKAEIDTMRIYADLGETTLSTAANAMPRLESSSACTGTPRRLSVPKRRGAWPARDRLNIMRVVM